MKNVLITPATYGTHGITRRAGMLTLLGGALALAGCGGGGDGLAAVGTGGTGSFSVGPITGFGSVIVNGVRFDDSSASVSDDDGTDMSGKLKLGMMVTVTGSALAGATTTTPTATANTIVIGGELQGPISAISANPQTLTVLGQTVRITGSTFFDVSTGTGFAGLGVNDIVEVHGVFNASDNSIQATFIEKKSSPAVFKIQGLASNHDAVAKKFNIGTVRINYSTTATDDVRIIPNNGTLVRVRVNAVLPPLLAPTEWTATRIRPPEGANETRDEAEIEGGVTAFTSATRFSVNGIPVNADAAQFEDGAVSLGMRVEVKGRLSAGVLIATRVKIENDNEIDDLEFELRGTITAGSLNTTTKTFVLRGVTVDFSGNVELRDGIDANLANVGLRSIKVKGIASPDGTKVMATRIEFES